MGTTNIKRSIIDIHQSSIVFIAETSIIGFGFNDLKKVLVSCAFCTCYRIGPGIHGGLYRMYRIAVRATGISFGIGVSPYKQFTLFDQGHVRQCSGMVRKLIDPFFNQFNSFDGCSFLYAVDDPVGAHNPFPPSLSILSWMIISISSLGSSYRIMTNAFDCTFQLTGGCTG
jgi:hypothetical protein